MAMFDYAKHVLFLANGQTLRLPGNLKRDNDDAAAEAVLAWARFYGLIKSTDEFVTLL